MKRWVLVSLGCGRRQYERTEFQRYQEDDARVAAERGGLEVRIVVGENDANLQIQQILEAVSAPERSRPVAVVAHTAAVVGFERVARTTLAAGVGWIVVDGQLPLDSLRTQFPDRLVSSASADLVEIGRLSARIARVLLPAGGKALVVEGPPTTAVSIQRQRGLKQGLDGSKIEVVHTLVADWKTPGAMREAEAWLDSARDSAVKPDLVISQNDEMAEGVLRAISAKRPDWGKVPAIGIDGVAEYGQRLVREGVLAATIINPAPTGPGVNLVVRWLSGEKVTPVTVQVRPFPALEQLAQLRQEHARPSGA